MGRGARRPPQRPRPRHLDSPAAPSYAVDTVPPARPPPSRLVVLLALLHACAPPDEAALPGGPAAPNVCEAALPTPALDDAAEAPVDGLPRDWRSRYAQGESSFEQVYRERSGLGPTYVHSVCAACHAGAGRGPKDVTKMVVMDGDAPAADQSALPWGPTVRPEVAGGGTTPILPPEGVDGLRVTTRYPNALWGRGYLEAIADSEIEAVEAEQAAGGVVSGRINRIAWSGVEADSAFHAHQAGDIGLIGRFGHKARVATLDEFAADALVGDMAITSPLRPSEHPNPDELTDDDRDGVDASLDTVNLLGDYPRALAIPARTPSEEGAAVFAAIGCADCHVPSLRTRGDYPIAALADVDAEVYTDLLLHDMGEALADGQEEGDAGSAEWRTAPLIGLRHLDGFLHDGRADTLGEAIAAHGGEAADARAAFDALGEADRAAMCGFLGGL